MTNNNNNGSSDTRQISETNNIPAGSCPELNGKGVYADDSGIYTIVVKKGNPSAPVKIMGDVKTYVIGEGVSLSPDGWVVASLNDELYKMKSDGSGLQKLLQQSEQNEKYDFPMYSPDGKYIAFIGPYSKGKGIEIVDKNGKLQGTIANDYSTVLDKVDKVVISTESERQRLNWSPDGKSIAFLVHPSKYSYKHENKIYKVSKKGDNFQEGYISELISFALDPLWSSDGKYIAYALGYSFTTVDSNGTNEKQLVVNSLKNKYVPFWFENNKIAFIRYPNYDPNIFKIYPKDADIGIINSDGSNPKVCFDLSKLGPGIYRNLHWLNQP